MRVPHWAPHYPRTARFKSDCAAHALLHSQDVKVWLRKKLAECINGVRLQDAHVGDVLDLPASEARLLIAEEWAVLERRKVQIPCSVERRRPQNAPSPDGAVDRFSRAC